MHYIDFDNTIYETGKLTKDILIAFSKVINSFTDLDFNYILNDLQKSFNSTIDNFVSFSLSLSSKYNIKNSEFQRVLNEYIIINGNQYVFPDALKFLKGLQDEGEKVCILTYVSNPRNLQQQALKISGSGIFPYVTEVYNTTRYKFELEINYENGIFIDDSPRDLEGLYNAGARNLIRMNKPNNTKRTSKKLNLPIEIPTFESFDEIDFQLYR